MRPRMRSVSRVPIKDSSDPASNTYCNRSKSPHKCLRFADLPRRRRGCAIKERSLGLGFSAIITEFPRLLHRVTLRKPRGEAS